MDDSRRANFLPPILALLGIAALAAIVVVLAPSADQFAAPKSAAASTGR